MGLAPEKIHSIETTAADILIDAYGQNLEEILPPVDLRKIAEKNGLTIKIGKFSDPEISGVYKRDSQTIYISQDEQDTRQAFTIAHELGHFFLHEQKDSEVFFRKDTLELTEEKRAEEREANWFAASLLMPRDLTIKVWKTFRSIDKVAQLFSVSQSAAYYRLKNLGLVD